MRKFAFALLAIFFAAGSYAQDDMDMPDFDNQEVQSSKGRDSKKIKDTMAVREPINIKKFAWGIKANLNLASERNAPESRFRTGFAAGFFAQIKISERLSFQPELLYSQQGSWQYLNKGSRTSGDNTLRYDYINLPLLLKIYVLRDKLSIEVGPQVGYMVSHTEKRLPRNGTKRIETINKEWMNKYDIAAAIGASYKFYGPFDVYARYTYGFMNIYKKDTGIMLDKQKSYFVNNKNSVLQLGIAARF